VARSRGVVDLLRHQGLEWRAMGFGPVGGPAKLPTTPEDGKGAGGSRPGRQSAGGVSAKLFPGRLGARAGFLSPMPVDEGFGELVG